MQEGYLSLPPYILCSCARVESTVDEEPTIWGAVGVLERGRMRSASRLGSCACSSSCASVTVPENLAGLRPIPRAAGIRARIAARQSDRLGERPYCNEESGHSGSSDDFHPSLLELPRLPRRKGTSAWGSPLIWINSRLHRKSPSDGRQG